jgi:hypothetical protein
MLELTSYEMLDAGRSFLDSSAVAFTRGLALGSAYLVVAYRAGRELTTLQVTIINVAFLVFCGQALFIAFVDQQLGSHLVDTATAQGPIVAPSVMGHVDWVMVTASIAALVACLVFMWSVRHPKTE